MTQNALNDDDQNLFKWLAGGKLLISIIFLGIVSKKLFYTIIY